MKQVNSIKKLRTILGVICIVTLIGSVNAHTQSGMSFSISHDFLPYQEFDDQIIDTVIGIDTTYLNNPQVKLNKVQVSFSFPISFSEGRTVLVNEFTYQLVEFEFRNMTSQLERAHSASYTLMIQQELSKKWSLLAMATPSLASDLEAEVSEDDFNFQTVAIFIRQYSERLSIGYGAAYSTQFGSATPLPVLAFDWNNGSNLLVMAILPVSLEAWYRPSPKWDIGLIVTGDGNNYRGDPELYDVTNPELRYTMMTIGPAAKINLANKLNLHLEAGLIALHRFEFYDGDDEVDSFDLKPSQYVRVGRTFGE